MIIRFLTALSVGALLLTPAAATDRSLILDPAHSGVEVAVKVTVDSFVAHLERYEGSVTLTEEGRINAARFAFRFRDVKTGKKDRDEAMHKWQQTDVHPDGVFSLAALEAVDGNKFTATGQLTLHGVTRALRFPVSITREADRYTIDGDAPVDTREFGLPVIRMLGMLKVDPIVHVRFHLTGAAESKAGEGR
jgi:polyisoprenoid-binding protein YceI